MQDDTRFEAESPRECARNRPWYLDPTALTVALAVAGYPLAGLTSAYLGIFDNSISLTYRFAVLAMGAAALLINGMRFGLRPLDPWLSLFLVIYVTRLIWDSNRSDQPGADLALLYLAVGTLVPLLAVTLPRGGWSEANLATCFFWVGAPATTAAIFLSNLGFSLDADASAGRLVFEKLNPITIGHVAVTTLITILLGRTYWRMRSMRLASFLMLPACGIVMYLAASRGAVLSLILVLALYGLSRARWIVLLALLALPLLLIDRVLVIEGESIFEHLRFVDLGIEESSALRIVFARMAIEEFLNDPIFGSGYALDSLGIYPHNIVIESAMALGIGGFLLLSALIVRASVSAIRETSGTYCLTALLFVQYLAGSQFSGALWDQPALYIFMARLLTLADQRRSEQRESSLARVAANPVVSRP